MIATNRLKQVEIFEGLTEDQIRLLAPHMRERHYRSGEVLFREGQPARSLIVLLEGLVSLRAEREGETTMLASLRGRQILGWSAVVGGGVYRATAFCLEDSAGIELDGDDLQQLCEAHPALGVRILRQLGTVIADRLDATRRQLGRRLRPGLISHG